MLSLYSAASPSFGELTARDTQPRHRSRGLETCRRGDVAELTWATIPSISPDTRSDPEPPDKQDSVSFARRQVILPAVALRLYSSLPETRSYTSLLTFLILRLMIDSAANTLSPTADSSMFAPVLPTVSQPASGADIFPSGFPTDHNTPQLNGRQRDFFFYSVAK